MKLVCIIILITKQKMNHGFHKKHSETSLLFIFKCIFKKVIDHFNIFTNIISIQINFCVVYCRQFPNKISVFKPRNIRNE